VRADWTGEGPVPFGPESFVVLFVHDQIIQNYKFSCCLILVWTLVCHIEWGTYAESICEQGAEEGIGPKKEEVRGEWPKL
jgi:hypothetical protein